MIRRTRVEVDLDAIVGNARTVRTLASSVVYAVVKADAYGHGAVAVARALAEAKAASGFAVSLVEEGVVLREAGITAPVLVMGPSQHGGEDEMVTADLTPVIGSLEDVEAIAAVAQAAAEARSRRTSRSIPGWAGSASRSRAPGRSRQLAGQAGIRIVGLMTHFACADSDDPNDPESMTRAQLQRFAEADRIVTAAGAPLRVRHAANSSGALLFPEARFDLVRTGIAIYGNGRWPVGTKRQQAMRLVSEVAQVRAVVAGTAIGYGATWTAKRASKLAVLPVGYADGLPRRASGHAEVAIRGKRAPLVGRISMDIAIADVTDIPEVAVGDAAVLLGRASGGASISAAEYGDWAGLSEYEVTCGMSKRVPRTYVGEAA